MVLENDLASHVESILNEYHFKKVERKKIIRDAVWGTYELSPFEVSILDLPFVQRLRGISQTALANFTYPSSNHNRFEHSLGVSIMADRMGKALGDAIDKKTLLELRVAGLLHDIGHGPFSHGSEEIIRELADCKEAIAKDDRFSVWKPHEMISYKLLQTKNFQELFAELMGKYGITLDLRNISEMIIGHMSNKKDNQFKADIINGAFDADKLDYLSRDAYFTGTRMVIDTERIFATLQIEGRPKKTRRIIVDVGGVHILEQILFNKMLLYPSVYHHHKVRAALCMMRSVFEMIRDNKMRLNGLTFNKVSDFLKVDDSFFKTTFGKPEKVAKQIEKIKRRDLLKRALVISRKTLKKEDGFDSLLALRDRPQRLREIAKAMTDNTKMKAKYEYYDFWIDLPEDPRFPEPSQCLIKVTDNKYLPLNEFFPVAEWTTSFEINKWRGYVFCPCDLQNTSKQVAEEVLQDLFGLKFNRQATVLAKHPTYSA